MQTQSPTTRNSHEESSFHIGVGEKNLVTLPSDSLVLDAVEIMREHNIGDVIITENLDGELFPVGIVTDRDLALEVLSQCANVDSLKVSIVMNKFLVTCPMGTGVFDMIRIMKEEGVSRLPIVSESGALKGLVNSKNLMRLLIAGLEDLAHISDAQKIHEKETRH